MADTVEVQSDTVEKTNAQTEVAEKPETTSPEGSADATDAVTSIGSEEKTVTEGGNNTLKRKPEDDSTDAEEAKKSKADEIPVENGVVESKDNEQKTEKTELLPEETTKTAEDAAPLAAEVTEGVAA